MIAPRAVNDSMRCRACGAGDRPFPPGIIGIELCLLCSNDLREYCRSFGEDVSHKRREAWLKMVSQHTRADKDAH